MLLTYLFFKSLSKNHYKQLQINYLMKKRTARQSGQAYSGALRPL